MGHIRKKVNLRIIYFAFLFLFEFLHLPTMLPVAASLEIHNRIQGTTYNQQSIHDISPDGKIERRKNMYFQGYSLFIPYPIAIRDFHPESVIAIPQVGVSDDRALAYRQPVCIKTVQLIHYPAHSRSLEVQCRHTERERVLIGLKYKFVGKGDALLQRRTRFAYIHFLAKEQKISNHDRRKRLVL